jgi:hypothetical protein
MSPTLSPPAGVHVDPRDLFRMYLDGDHVALTRAYLGVLDYLNQTTYLELDDANRASIIQFVKTFLTLFTQPDYVIPEDQIQRFVNLNELISNLVAMTPFRTTDGFLELLRYQPSNLVKILTLYSARNRVRFDRRSFFDAHPHLATVWWCKFCSLYKSGLVSEEVGQHLSEHLSYHDERMFLTPDITEPYFGSTYLDGVVDRHVKPFLNQVVRRSTRMTCENRPNPRKVAVVSDLWNPTHSVYRTLYGYVRSLKDRFHLTLIHSLVNENMDRSLFDDVLRLDFRDMSLDVAPLRSNDFAVVYFPDIGMSLTSIMLANYRIAPVQLCGTGHPVSTWGSEVDYFVSGVEVDTPETAERNYSERVLLLPGMGAIHNRPNFTPTGRAKTVPEVIINFPSSGQKVNARFLRTLRKLLDQVHRPVRFRFFPATLDIANSYMPFMAAVREALGGTSVILDVMPFLPYREYMGFMEEGDLTLDAYHFGGSNIMSDSLWVRTPVVAWQGDKWYNRIGAAMLRRVGLDELISNSEGEYLDLALRLIHDDRWREELTLRLQAVDLEATVFSETEAASFRRAIEYLITNHDRLRAEPGRKPIRIL